MDKLELIPKKKKTKRIKPILEIIEEVSPKNVTLKSSSLSSKGKRCKKGTKKYKPLGLGCFSQEDINNFRNTVKQTKKLVELEVIDEPEELIIVPEKRIELDIFQKKKLSKRRLKTPIELEIMEKKKRYNEEFIELMEKLNNIMLKQGEHFRARAYQKAQETLMTYQDDITSPSQLKGLPGIGSTIMDKLNEYVQTGTLRVLEREKTNPINILGEIYGVGPKKLKN